MLKTVRARAPRRRRAGRAVALAVIGTWCLSSLPAQALESVSALRGQPVRSVWSSRGEVRTHPRHAPPTVAVTMRRHLRARPPSAPLRLTASAHALTVPQGGNAVLEVATPEVRHARTGPTLTARMLPRGVRLDVDRHGHHHPRFTVRLSTDRHTPTGVHLVTLVVRHGSRVGRVRLRLTVIAGSRPLTIRGTVDGLLAPGVTRPVDLRLGNPNATAIEVTQLWVSVIGIDRADSACAVEPNYRVQQFTGRYRRLVIPARGSRALSEVYPVDQWPQLEMVETGTNQNACKGATLTLRYEGTARGGHR